MSTSARHVFWNHHGAKTAGKAASAFAALVCLAFVILAMGCSGDGLPSTTPSPSPGATERPRPTFAAESTMAKIAAKGKLTVGVKFDQPGFGLKDAVSGKVDGFDIQIAREIASALGLSESQVEFVETVSVDRIPALASGRVDLVVATMTVTAEREAEIDFSRPYYVAGQSILVRKGSTAINGLQDLAGRKVCSVRGSTSEQTLREKAPGAELVLLDGYAACVRDLKAGSADAVSTDDVILAGFAASDNTLKLVGGQFTREPYGVGVPRGQADFVAFINAVLDGAIAGGSWERSYDKYLGKVEGLPRVAEAKAKLPRE